MSWEAESSVSLGDKDWYLLTKSSAMACSFLFCLICWYYGCKLLMVPACVFDVGFMPGTYLTEEGSAMGFLI